MHLPLRSVFGYRHYAPTRQLKNAGDGGTAHILPACQWRKECALLYQNGRIDGTPFIPRSQRFLRKAILGSRKQA